MPTSPQPTIAVLGGTGPHGRGLVARLAFSGYDVRLGSRSATRAEEALDKLASSVPRARVTPGTNEAAAAGADVVIVAVPYDGLAAVAAQVADAVAGKPVLSCVNPLTFDDQGPAPVFSPAGSAAQELALLLPDSPVVSAFQNVSARKLNAVDTELGGDVLLCGDDAGALQVAAQLVESVPHLRPIHAGPLRLSGIVEHLTVVLLSVNRRYGALASIALEGVNTDGSPFEAA